MSLDHYARSSCSSPRSMRAGTMVPTTCTTGMLSLLALASCRIDPPNAGGYEGGSESAGSEGADSQSMESWDADDSTSVGPTSVGSTSVGSTSVDSTSVGPIGTEASSSEAESTSGSTSVAETSTGPGPVCGDDIAEAGESCDGIDLGGASCESEGFDAGSIGCLPDCSAYDASGCVTFACGNEAIEGLESCDGANLAGNDCVGLGFDGGLLGCLPDCSAYDTTGCVIIACGNGVPDPGEECDAGGESPICDANCTFAMCGDRTINASMGEACEAGNLAGASCASLGFDGGTLGCNGSCQFDTTACYTCGDGMVDFGEDCDGANLGGQTCQGLGFDGGTLACTGGCAYDTPACSLCGDGVLHPGVEQCDGSSFGGQTCQSFGFDSGSLTCAADCSAVGTSGCGTCGNGVIDGDESCDDGNSSTLCLPGCVPCAGDVLFQEDFSDNSAGWTLDGEWQIGATVASMGQAGGCIYPDPELDHTPTAENGVAGVVLGGNASLPIHPFYYLTSPSIDASGYGTLQLSFWRWLNSDYTPFMQNHIQVFDGLTWHTIWESGPSPNVSDGAWTLVSYDVSAYVNPALRIRIGFDINSDGVWTCSGWNVDDLVISESLCP